MHTDGSGNWNGTSVEDLRVQASLGSRNCFEEIGFENS